MLRKLLAAMALVRLQTTGPLMVLAHRLAVTHAHRNPGRTLAIVTAFGLIVAAGFAYNDVADRNCDAVNRPRRPLVSGLIAVGAARWFFAIASVAGIGILAVAASPLTIGVTAALVASGVVYSLHVKRVAGLKNVFVAAWCAILPLIAFLDAPDAVRGALWIAAAIFCFILQKEIVADVYDQDGDRRAGIMTLPVTFGSRLALTIVIAANVVVLALPIDDVAVAGLASLNIATGAVVFVVPRSIVVRAYLELQKAILIGGCLLLFVR